MKERIVLKSYFWLSIIFPIFISLVVLSITFEGITEEKYIETLKTVFTLLAFIFISVGASFTYYRIDLSYQQHELQLEQQVHSHYKDFKDEFFMLADERNYEYKILDIPNSWLFNSLYPDAKKGNHNLIKEFEELLRCDDGLYGFQCVFDSIRNSNNKSGDKYRNITYQPIALLFGWFKEMFAFDVKLNMSYSQELYSGDFANYTYMFISDFLHIISIVNTFQGWHFFDNKKRREWLNIINNLEATAVKAEKISEYFSSTSCSETQQHWHRHEFDSITNQLVMRDFPTELQNDLQAKFYIYESFTDNRYVGSNIPEEGKTALASALGINQYLQ